MVYHMITLIFYPIVRFKRIGEIMGTDLLALLIKLLADQENVEITYEVEKAL